MTDGQANGWHEWRRHVLAELQRQNTAIENVRKEMALEQKARQTWQTRQEAEMMAVKIKLAFIGAIAGIVASGVVSLLVHFISH